MKNEDKLISYSVEELKQAEQLHELGIPYHFDDNGNLHYGDYDERDIDRELAEEALLEVGIPFYHDEHGIAHYGSRDDR